MQKHPSTKFLPFEHNGQRKDIWTPRAAVKINKDKLLRDEGAGGRRFAEKNGMNAKSDTIKLILQKQVAHSIEKDTKKFTLILFTCQRLPESVFFGRMG
jgi:hypothetical protein